MFATAAVVPATICFLLNIVAIFACGGHRLGAFFCAIAAFFSLTVAVNMGVNLTDLVVGLTLATIISLIFIRIGAGIEISRGRKE